jgi:non-heme chloroperoxidase
VLTVNDGTEIFYKDWGKGQPVVFHHGWPLSADDWDSQMLFFLGKGYRVIAHDRRGHGRSTQTNTGNDMDTYADDVAALVTALDLKEAIHIGHSTGGGEVVRFLARHGTSRASKAAIITAIPSVMVKSPKNPGGTPMEVFDGFRAAQAANRTQFFSMSRRDRSMASTDQAPSFRGHHPRLVAPRHDGRHQGPLRLYRGLF